MAKRFIDTKIWDKAWFRKLSAENKLLWVYILTKCDHAGILDEDWEAASFFIGYKMNDDLIPIVIKNKIIRFGDSGKMLRELRGPKGKGPRWEVTDIWHPPQAKKKKGKQSEKWDEFLNEFYKFLRLNKCMKIKMCTKLPAKFWIEEYGFKLKRYQMELDL